MIEKKQYLETVIEQIRFEKARHPVLEELENHIEDQKDAYLLQGVEVGEAYERAVKQMGDPVEVGIALDRVHRPKMEWKMILLVLGISLLGFFFQVVMMLDMGREIYPYNIAAQFVFLISGFVVMMFFCFLDYTRIGTLAKGGALFCIMLLLYSFWNGVNVYGRQGYIYFLGVTISLHQLMYLYIPFFGGILYAYRLEGKKGFFKSFIWMVVPVILVFRLPNLSMAMNLLVIMMLQMLFVVKKGWFDAGKIKKAFLTFMLVGSPIFLFLYFILFGAPYQRARILSFFMMPEGNYLMNTARKFLLESKLWGRSAEGVGAFLTDVASDYILTYLVTYYGILAVIVLISILGFFLFKVFHISIRQKNQLGHVIGIGCSLVFATQIILYVLVNFTLFPSTSVFLPLFSYGGTGTIVSFALIGILLSIYRYQNVLPMSPERTLKKRVSNLLS